MRITLVFLLAALPILCLGQQTQPPVDDDIHLRTFKLGIDAGCRDAGKRENDPPEKVNAFCTCVMKTLQSEVPPKVWQEISAHLKAQRPDLANQALGPYLSKLSKCSPSAPKI
jgi:hypothetical protein